MGMPLPEKLSTSNIVGNLPKEKLQVPSVFQKLSLLQPLKAPKSYGTYSKQQQEEVIAFIKDGNSLRTAEKYFGIPKSTMHCWLKKVHLSNGDNGNTKYNQPLDIDTYTMSNTIDDKEDASGTVGSKKSPSLKPSSSPRTSLSSPRASVASSANNSSNNTTNSTNNSAITPQLVSPVPNTGVKKAETQIIIEEAELIRFLQTAEGAELIGKAYNLPVPEFLNFVKNSQFVKREESKSKQPAKTDDMVSLLKPTSSGVGNIKEESKMSTSPYPFSGMRKRNFNTSGCKCQTTFRKAIATELKKPKLDNTHSGVMETASATSSITTTGGGGGVLEALLTKPRDLKHLGAPAVNNSNSGNGTLVLTEEQIKTSNKLISQAQPGVVNTYLVTVPLSSLPGSLTPLPKPNEDVEECELSPTYPVKVVNPVSIKAESVDSDCMMRPPGSLPLNTKNTSTVVSFPKIQTLLNQATKPIVSTNATAALNLNAINRTQSERELMALVDGDVVSADELCTDFNETLELNKWVNNENWYTDQYLQHFQMPSVTTTQSATDTISTASIATAEKSDDDFEDDDDAGGITFASVSDKDKIISYLSLGNDIELAVKRFGIPQSTITRWLSSVDKNCENKDVTGIKQTVLDSSMKPTPSHHHQQQQTKSAFAFSSNSSSVTNSNNTQHKSSGIDNQKSAFARPFN